VRTAQTRLGLGVDGRAGPKTMGALRAAAAKTAAKDAAVSKANDRADSAWAIAAQAHADGKWEQALAAYAEVITLAEDAGNTELQSAAAARLREARLRKPPTPYGDLRAAPTDKAKEDTKEIVAKRALADQQYKDKQYAKALATYQSVYEGSSGGANETEDAWAIASSHHQLGHFEDAVSWYRQAATHFTAAGDADFALIVFERTREATLHKPPTPSEQLKKQYVAELGDEPSDPAEVARTEALRAKAGAAEDKYASSDVKGALAGFLDVYREAAPFKISLVEVLYNIGVCHHRLGNYEQAVEFYRQAREANRGRDWYIAKLERLGGDGSELAATAADARDGASAHIAKALRHQKL
jgi:tetratricopeptide (TPR) repeat protein